MQREGFRVWKIDSARGTAVLMMLCFNWLYALYFFGLLSKTQFDPTQGFWWAFARVTGAMFVFLAGASVWLQFSRSRDVKGIALRGAKIFALGMLVTIATWIFIGRGFVVFGVLHLIGFAIACSALLLRRNASYGKIALLGALCVFAGILLSAYSFGFPWLVWLGFTPAGFYSVDHFPVLPWIGVFLLGLAFAKKRYAELPSPGTVQPGLAGKAAAFLGRHSLTVYLLHQPILVLVLYLLGFNPLHF